MGWNGYTETRILLWDSVLYWKIYKANVLKKEKVIETHVIVLRVLKAIVFNIRNVALQICY